MERTAPSDSGLRRNPGFGSAKTVLLSQLQEGNWVATRIRVVGKMKAIHHDELLLEQCGIELLVRIRGPYYNEHRCFLFIEVLGEVTENRLGRVEMDGYLFRGLSNFNWELYQMVLARRQQFLDKVERDH